MQKPPAPRASTEHLSQQSQTAHGNETNSRHTSGIGMHCGHICDTFSLPRALSGDRFQPTISGPVPPWVTECMRCDVCGLRIAARRNDVGAIDTLRASGHLRMTATHSSSSRNRAQGLPPMLIHTPTNTTAVSTATASTHAATGGTWKRSMPLTITDPRTTLVDATGCHRACMQACKHACTTPAGRSDACEKRARAASQTPDVERHTSCTQ